MKSVKKYLGLIISAVAILALLYLGFIRKSLDSTYALMGVGMVVLLGLNMYTTSLKKAQQGGRTVSYREAYAEFIGDSFSDDRSLEQKLYVALENLGLGKNKAAVKRLDELLPLCRNDDERFTCHVFKGMAHNRNNDPSKAVASYKEALTFKETTTTWSNLGLCLSKIGDEAAAEEAYVNAIGLDENNAYALNNLAQLCIAQRDFEAALTFANRAFQAKDGMVQAVNALAICHGVLGNAEQFETYFGLSTRLGADGTGLKRYIEELKNEQK